MDRIRSAIVLPTVVFAICAIVAIGVGMLLHLVHDITHHSGSHFLEEFGTPLVALLMVILVTAAGFVASAAAGPEPE